MSAVDPRDVIRTLIEAAGENGNVTLPCRLLAPLLAGQADTPDTVPGVDYTLEEVGKLMHRSPITVREWCRAGLLPGAYRLRGRSWKVPHRAVEAFQRAEAHRRSAA